VFFEIFILKFDIKLIGNLNYFIYLDMLFDILEVFEDGGKIIVDDDVFT
jgi:hypothetical protein